MADNLRYQDTSVRPTKTIGLEVDKMMKQASSQRKSYERRWYDNHFFDDGHHFRYISRTTGRIVDLQEKGNVYNPQRAIPKASRQIRGMINLILSGALVPVARPVKVEQADYPNPQEYQQALQSAKDIAKRTGHWLEDEMLKKQDMDSKLAYLLYIAALERVAWIQVYPDPVDEKICTVVRDNFEMYYVGNLVDYEKSPFLILGYPKLISEVKANEYYDKDELAKLSPDNKFAHSEIKEAYLRSKMGAGTPSDGAATVIVKEAYIREFLNDDNMETIRSQKDGKKILKDRKIGDPVIRQAHVVGDVVLYDVYTALPGYPFVPYMYEPGPLHGPALIERFIPQNKSLDVAVSRLERFLNSMTVGIWMKRRGENVEISNLAGGQILEYDATPPVQGNVESPGQGIFQFIGMLESFIEEQGVTTSALGKLPSGVKANAAIESLKASEFANLKIPLDQLKKTIRAVCEKMLDIADNYFTKPQTVEFLHKGEPDYFDIMGKSALDKSGEIGKSIPQGVIPISKDYGVDINIESGLGFTPEGKRDGAKQMLEMLTPYAQMGIIPAELLKPVIEKVVETYQFGNTQEIAEALDLMPTQTTPLNEQQIDQVKIALAQVMKDIGLVGDKASEQRIMENKIGVVEGLKDSGMMDQQKPQEAPKGPSETIAYKDLPPEGKVQLAAQAGIQLDPQTVATHEEKVAQQDLINKSQELELKQQEHQMKMAQAQQNMGMKAQQAEQSVQLKQHTFEQGSSLKEKQINEGMRLKKKAMNQQMKLKEEAIAQQATMGANKTKSPTKGNKRN